MWPTKLTLGPVFFHWSAEKLADFYRRIADEAPVDRVHVGEVVCGKRLAFSDPVWPDVIERLEQGGKEVVLSTLAAPANVRECKVVRELCHDTRLVEINDLTALPSRRGQPFVAGPFINTYNEATARYLIGQGALTICPPIELSLATIGGIAKACPEAEFEAFAFGRLPLALSGRCYHARLHGLHKDSCRFTCEKGPDGLAVDTMEGQDFLAINGVQTLSNQVHAACPAPERLAALGIGRLRLSPHSCDMVQVARIYRDLLDGHEDAEGAQFLLSCLDLPGRMVDGFLHGKPGVQPVAVI